MKSLIQRIRKAIFFLCIVPFLATTALNAQDMNFDLSLSSTTPVQGQELRLSVSTDNSDGLYYFGFEVTYDQNAFEFVGVEPGEIMNPNPLSVGGSLATDRVGASVVRTSDVASGEGQVMELTFLIKDDATPGEFQFGISAADARSGSGGGIDLVIPSIIPFEVLDKNILRDVTFSVNMNAQIDNGTFNPAIGDQVYVRGGFNDWSANAASLMTDNGDGIYELTLSIAGNEGANIQYKFFMGAGDARPLPNTGWEGSVGSGPDGNRLLTLGPENTPQVLPVVFFNNIATDTPTRNVTFSVDMNVQISNGNFNPASDVVRVNGGFSGWDSIVMTESGTSGIYTHTASVTGDAGVIIEYKYMINNDFEGSVGDGSNGNRQLTLGPGSTPQILPTVFFNNEETFEPVDPEITFANLQFPGSAEIDLGGAADVYAQVTITGLTPGGAGYEGLSVWVGYSSENTDPSTWETWVDASFIGVSGFTSRAEYLAQIGADITEEGEYYYATRFQLDGGDFVFGGFSEEGGGFWDGTANVSGVLTVSDVDPVDPEITFANLQFPGSAEIDLGAAADVYAQVTITGLTPGEAGYEGLSVWVGYSSENTDPSTWETWVDANFIGVSGFTSRAEYLAQIGADITEEGEYFYATRFQLDGGDFVFGGFSEDGGGFWDGTANVSGVLTVNEEGVLPDSRIVIFSVDMSVQIALGNFDPENDVAGVSGSFNGWEVTPLSTVSEIPGIYEAEITIDGEEGEIVEYKFRINDEFELLGEDPLQNRQFTLSAPDVTQLLDTVFYSDIDEVPGPARLNVAVWNFEDAEKRALYVNGSTLTYTADDGLDSNKDIAQINLNGPTFSGWVLGSGGTGSGTSAANSNNWTDGANSKYWTVSVSTAGYESIYVSSKQQSSNTGPRDFQLQFRVGNSGDWASVDGGSITVANNFISGVLDNVVLPEVANNQNVVQLRWLMTSNTSVNGSVVANTGTNRIDDITITGTSSDAPAPDPEITFANLQFPGSATIELGESVSVFGQVTVTGADLGEAGYEGLQVWVGYSAENTNPSGWTNWVVASYNGLSEFGDRPEYTASIGSSITEAGTYYFATRFQLGENTSVFGGFSEDGGGFWNGTSNVSGVLTVTADTDPETVVVWPGDTNNDGVVDALDVLAIGSYFGLTGPARETQGTAWAPVTSLLWEPVQATYADTDGSGLVNQTDLLAVGLNFGETHGDVTLATESFTFSLPAIGVGQFLRVDLSVLEQIALQGVGFMIRIEGLTSADANIQDIETGIWAADWEANNSLISFERVNDLDLGLAYIHRGSTMPVNADVLASFSIIATTQWPLGATLVVDRVVYVNADNQQVTLDDLDAEISIQGSVNINNPDLPVEMALRSNYPNPFNPTTNIVFDISEHTAVTIEVMNILGQRVAVLANNEELAPGQYIRVFDAGRLTSGVYLVRMTAGSQAFTQKIMLVK